MTPDGPSCELDSLRLHGRVIASEFFNSLETQFPSFVNKQESQL